MSTEPQPFGFNVSCEKLRNPFFSSEKGLSLSCNIVTVVDSKSTLPLPPKKVDLLKINEDGAPSPVNFSVFFENEKELYGFLAQACYIENIFLCLRNFRKDSNGKILADGSICPMDDNLLEDFPGIIDDAQLIFLSSKAANGNCSAINLENSLKEKYEGAYISSVSYQTIDQQGIAQEGMDRIAVDVYEKFQQTYPFTFVKNRGDQNQVN